MRTARGLFHQLCQIHELEAAAWATVRGKRRRADVARFIFRLDGELAALSNGLETGVYRPSDIEVVSIRDPKPRLIARVPIRDRVVQTALVRQFEPVFEPGYSPDDYACRPGFGTHRAVLRLWELMRRFRFAVHLDVHAYFPSIDPDILRPILSRRIRDESFLSILDHGLNGGRRLYVDSRHRQAAALDPSWPPPGRGLAVGSYTSQIFAAHIYLNTFDHWVKRDLKVPGYLRYVDDMFLFGNRRRDLRQWRHAVGDWLYEQRHLRLKHPQARILSCRGHLDALGHRIRRDHVEALPRASRRFARTLAQALDPFGRPPRLDLNRSIAASLGVLLV